MSDLDLGEDPNWWEPAEADHAQADLARALEHQASVLEYWQVMS